MGKISKRQLKLSITVSIIAQAVSMLVSVIISLAIPKYCDGKQYALWQLYVLYVNYVGILHLGMLDGIVLRYSQFDYEELDKPLFANQFKLLSLFNWTAAIVICCISMILADDYLMIFVFVAFGTISKNAFNYTSYVFQITNRINNYARLIIIQRVVYAVGVSIILVFRINNYEYICLMDVISDFVGVLYGVIVNKDLYFTKKKLQSEDINEAFTNIKTGIVLLLSNWVSLLLVGLAKTFIQLHWGNLTFGKVSFAFSLANLFLTFVSAISIAVFPSLKRLNQDDLPDIYIKSRNTISVVLYIAMGFYFPCKYFVTLWLHQYIESLDYLAILMPMVVSSTKVALLTNNYLKAFRKEKSLLFINLISVIIALLSYYLAIVFFDSVSFVLLAVVIASELRSVISEIIVLRTIDMHGTYIMFEEIAIQIVFVLLINFCSQLVSIVVFAISVVCCIIVRGISAHIDAKRVL